MEASTHLNVTESSYSDRDCQFTDLNDDVLGEIFKYVDATQRTTLEVMCRRFGELLPTLCHKLDGDEFPFLGRQSHEETTTFFHLAGKSRAIKHVDFGSLSQDTLLSMFIGDSRTFEWFANVLNSTIESMSLRVYDDYSSVVHFAAVYARNLGANCGIKTLDLSFSTYLIKSMDVGMARFTALVRACPKLETLKVLVQDSYADESADSSLYRLVRDEADTMWSTIASIVKVLEIKYYDSPYPKFGNLHYTGHSWTNLEKVTIKYQLTPAYVKQLVANAPKLESVSLIVEDLACLNTISKLNNLNSVKLKYSEILESDAVRRTNCTLFRNFIIRRGRQLKEIFLTMPYQDNCFFDPVMKHCNQTLVTKLRLRSSPKRTFDTDKLVKLPNVRRLQLEAALKVETINFILEKCPKLKRFHFVIPAFQRSSMESLKAAILNYSANHPKRLILAEIETCGSTYYHRSDDFRVGNCVLKVTDSHEPQY
ncbi:hypothetical protein HDE_01149 [Halotydeus destructor]|nr:hypothetical protein HDE_01149 [Halotydeus destructor]